MLRCVTTLITAAKETKTKQATELKSCKQMSIFLMPDEDKKFGGSLVLDFRKWWHHMQAKNIFFYKRRKNGKWLPFIASLYGSFLMFVQLLVFGLMTACKKQLEIKLATGQDYRHGLNTTNSWLALLECYDKTYLWKLVSQEVFIGPCCQSFVKYFWTNDPIIADKFIISNL